MSIPKPVSPRGMSQQPIYRGVNVGDDFRIAEEGTAWRSHQRSCRRSRDGKGPLPLQRSQAQPGGAVTFERSQLASQPPMQVAQPSISAFVDLIHNR